MSQFSMIGGLRIVTASWYSALPSDVVRVSISRGPRRGQRGYRGLPFLAPGRWYRTVDENEYIDLYNEQLGHLDPDYVSHRLIGCAAGAPIVALLCFERPFTDDGWCHRSLTAAWLSKEIGVPVPEFGYEHLPQADHPMLPPSLKRSFSPSEPA